MAAPKDDNTITFSAKEGPNEEQFKQLKISHLVDKKKNNYDIAKAICGFYDELYGDTDTVCIITDEEKAHPAVGAWAKGNFQRMEKNMNGKYLFLYRATKHEKQTNFKTTTLKPEKFKAKAEEYANAFYDKKIEITAEALDKDFKDGCHIVRCPHKQFDVFCRYSDGFQCEFKLPNKEIYICAWRR
eukprot:CAMPEP_0202698664 /NCGR_PEP_ID=MMETSP1385-20130828/11913_1 /ASSEMBLY_ACC=CAM_ASM_000861 /TAXON_ID=933848 /ORGANISM="Elphidium margaritaceum" /LENGTH=185 /DNA_ID=CAMNT_0049355427 /DNA_START=97 /DNA_END=654 /DNA_ORIENTATION=-